MIKKGKRLIAFLIAFSFLCALTEAPSAKTTKVMKLNQKSIALEVGQSTTLKVVNATGKITYSSNKKSIASVTKKGKVVAQKEGKAKITVTVVTSKKIKNSSTGKNQTKKITQKFTCPVTVAPLKTPDYTTEQVDEQAASQARNFAVNLFKSGTKSTSAQNDNIVISPYSITMAMLMCANGADGNTLKQMKTAMAGNNCSMTRVTNFIRGLNTSFSKRTKPSSYEPRYLKNTKKRSSSDKASAESKPEIESIFHNANSIWINKDRDFTVLPSFIKKNRTTLLASSYNKSFKKAKTLKDINTWIEDNTNGIIKNAVPSLGSDNAMLLINAMVYDNQWVETYNEYHILPNETFTRADGVAETATMLCDNSEGSYFEDETATGFFKKYRDGYSYMALLPKEEASVDTVLEGLTGDKIKQFYDNRFPYEKGKKFVIHTRIPKYSYDYNFSEANDALQQMGITDAFDDGLANFSKMAKVKPGENLYVGEIIHKAHIELDEKGTTAAATTIISMNLATAGPPEEEVIVDKYVYLDRPFIYVIIDNQTCMPLFMGVVNSLN